MLRHVNDLERFKNKINSTQDSQCYGDEGCHSTQEDEFQDCFISDALPKEKNASQWPFSFFFWGYRDASLGVRPRPGMLNALAYNTKGPLDNHRDVWRTTSATPTGLSWREPHGSEVQLRS